MNITHKLSLDLGRKDNIPTISVMQGDTARSVEISLYENGVKWVVPDGASAYIAFRSADGKNLRISNLADGTPAVAYKENVVFVSMDVSLTTHDGTIPVVVVFVGGDGKQIATFPFGLNVLENPASDSIDAEPISPDEFTQLLSAIAFERKRIDNLLASETVDGELIDLRLGYDGKTYTTAGEAVRAQVSEISDRLNNAIDIPYTFIAGAFINPATGLTGAYSSYSYTDFIPVANIAKIQLRVSTKIAKTGLAFYKVNTPNPGKKGYGEDFVGGVDFGTYTFGSTIIVDVPDGALYMRVCSLNTELSKFFIRAIDVHGLSVRLSNEIKKNTKSIDGILTFNTTLIDGSYVNSVGGLPTGVENYSRTDYIELHCKTVKFPAYFSEGAGYSFYNASKGFISGGLRDVELGDIMEVTVPEGAKYLIVSCLVDNKDRFFVRVGSGLLESLNNDPDDVYSMPCDYTGNEFLTFRKILCIGDSLTEGAFDHYNSAGDKGQFINKGYAYPAYLNTLTGAEVTNAGDSGESIRTWYINHSGDDLSGHDCAVITLGLNDTAGQSHIVTTSEERMEYLGLIVDKLKAENKGIKIFLSTIFKCFPGAGKVEVNTDIINFANATPDVYLMDLYTYGKVLDAPQYKAGHLTAFGYRQLASDVFAYASYIMHNEPESFRFIQYVGTDYEYQ